MNNESLCTFRVMKVDEIKRNKGTQDGNVKSKVMGEKILVVGLSRRYRNTVTCV